MRALLRAQKASKAGDKDQVRLAELLGRVRDHLDGGGSAHAMELDEDSQQLLKPLCLLTSKPTMFIANVDEQGFSDNPYVERVKELARQQGGEIVVICAAIEAELSEMDDEDKLVFLEDMGVDEPGLNRVIRTGYKLLGLQTYFTAGPKEARAWTIRIGVTAPQAAGVIHTDFEKGFIRAEVTSYEDYSSLGGEQAAKEAGKLRLEGKDYVMHDGDVVHFRFNV